MKSIANRTWRRLHPFFDLTAWTLIAIGLAVFSLRVQFHPGGWINLPVAFTVFQTGGLFFALGGIQIMVSRAFWPNISVLALVKDAHLHSNVAAAVVLLGMFMFNGLSMIAFAMWLTSALGGQGVAAG